MRKPRTQPFALFAAMLLYGLAAAAPALAQSARYADIADLTLTAPVIVRATLAKAETLRVEDAGRAEAGKVRVLMTASVTAALRAPDAVPAQLHYLWDGPADARGKPPKVKGQDVLLFLRGIDGKPGQYQLVGASGQMPATPATDATVRAILAENAAGTAPVVTGIGNAFRVPGSVPGEAESQFFLTTANAKPVSLVLLSRPGQPQKLAVALGDVIDEAATGVQPDSLLWYRLACFLPGALPNGIGGDDRAALATDYAQVLTLLGACRRGS